MRKRSVVMRLCMAFLLFLVANTFFAFLSFHLTEWLLDYFHIYPQGYWRQLWTVLGVFLLFSCTAATTFFIGSKKQRLYWNTIVDALSRIAKGDFTVQLDLQTDERDQFGQLIHGINHMAVELGEMERMRQEFISNVSHEIQSPLTAINGFAKALQNMNLPEEKRQHYLEIIEMESYRLSKISDNLLKLTSLESEHHPFEPKNYRLDHQLRNVVLALEPNWFAKALEMDLQLTNLTVFADEDLMNQVWMNLLSNSIKFTPTHGTITLSMAQQAEHITIIIHDTGIGLTDEQQAHIFERFYKADTSRTAKNGGSGLGLAIVHKIITMHHGTIIVSSSPNNYTAFTITLPIKI
ncbi:sensor histidine kinase [Lysinibacillus piscis]|uniref:Heme sensor protein HssS n=1 Tax=Lysinibacillus piscis TaxID=2518931 RepID=A0ABQ5NH64_9BACI|nr:HAMP domain-containing sensor histidine kinase [Lysinibacillus sp. KH24]GLC87691.1 two-component sensor histidine kinase [Lysinibacillus sp. KH24]